MSYSLRVAQGSDLMFKVTIINESDKKETVIHESDSSNVKLNPAEIVLETNAIDTFDFSINPLNPGYRLISPSTTRIRVVRMDKNKILFDGRIQTPIEKMESTGMLGRSFHCESALAYLHDTRPGYLTITGTIPQIIKKLLDVHNSKVESYKNINVGDVSGTKQFTIKTTPEKDIYETMHDFIVTQLGYEHRLSIRNGSYYLDIAPEIGKKRTTRIELARNLDSMQVEDDPTGIFSYVIPLGAEKEQSGKADEVPIRVNLGDIKKPLDVGSQKLENKYGVKVGFKVFDTEKDANKLTDLAKQTLDAQKASRKYTVSALDLSLIGLEVDDFDVYDSYPTFNPLMSIDEYLKVGGMTINLNEPEKPTMTIGAKFKSAIDYQLENSDAVDQYNQLNQRYRDLNNNVSDIDGTLKDHTDDLAKMQDEIDKLKNQNGDVGKIIDISEWQATVDFNAVKADNTDLVIIRVQYGSGYKDLTYVQNIHSAQAAGMRYAVYAYARYTSAADAKTEATDFFNRTQQAVGSGSKPVFYMIDVEEQTATDMRGATQGWNSAMTSLGIGSDKQVAYIANNLYDTFNIDVSKFNSIIIPSYGINDGTVANSKRPNFPYDLWQYTSKGTVKGISGPVDMNTEPSSRFKEYLK